MKMQAATLIKRLLLWSFRLNRRDLPKEVHHLEAAHGAERAAAARRWRQAVPCPCSRRQLGGFRWGTGVLLPAQRRRPAIKVRHKTGASDSSQVPLAAKTLSGWRVLA